MMRLLALLCCLALPGPVSADAGVFLEFAKRGWVYDLRSAMWRRNPGMPRIVINGRDMAGSSLCLIGEPPHPSTTKGLEAFSALIEEIFGTPVPARYAGPDLEGCGDAARTVYLRLFSGRVPHLEYGEDIRAIDARFGLGFGRNRQHLLFAPGQAETFFGERGRVTHIAIKQPGGTAPGPLEDRFFNSILIEELYQSFTFGVDILHFDRSVAFVSKLEEVPMNLRALDWNSPQYMEAMLGANPAALCLFDIFMLHAVAASPHEATNSPAFLDFIADSYDSLLARSQKSWSDLAGSRLIDPTCGGA